MSDLPSAEKVPNSKKLDYLLNKTKLFTHFINKNIGVDEEKSNKLKSPNKNVNPHVQTDDEELEDQKETGPMVFRQTPFYIKFAQLRDYQIEGLNWLISIHHSNINGILADEMGLGKTVQTISLLGYLKHFQNKPKYHIVICPKSTLSNWVNEFKRWCPSFHTESLQGSADERKQIVDDIIRPGKFEVLITTFEQCIINAKALKKIKWGYMVIDEAHRIKNENSMLSEIVRQFSTRNRLLLTGTPLQNNLHELWALLNFLLPEVFDSSEDFDAWFSDEECLGQDNDIVHKLHIILKPFLLRRLKAEVEKTLPAKKELKLYVGLSKMQREWYKAVLLKDLGTLNGQTKENARLNNILMQLRKVCNHPYLFDGAEPGPPYTTDSHLVTNCGKMVLLDKLLLRLFEQGHRVLIFSQMTSTMNIIEDYLVWKSYKYCRLDGNTSYDERQEYIADFNKPNSEKFVFILSTRAGGLGINLTSADVVILYDSDWNPQQDLQAQDRAHRIGQTKPVMVFRLVTENSVEERIIERAEMKLKLDNVVIQQGRLIDQKASKLSKDDMLSMIRHGAENIIHSNVDEITYDDIDVILQRAEEKKIETDERLAKIEQKMPTFKIEAEKNPELKDIYEFEGLSYREKDLKIISAPYDPSGDVRKRERRAMNLGGLGLEENYEANSRAPKLPRLPQIQDFQFFPPELHQIFEKEILYHKKATGYRPTHYADMDDEETVAYNRERQAISSAEPLTDEEIGRKDAMLTQGYTDWSRKDFLAFVKANEKFGKSDIKNIVKSVPSKSEAEVMDYYNTFWARFSELTDSQKYLVQIEKGEAKIIRHEVLKKALAEKIESYEFPYQLKVPGANLKNKYFNELEDRFLLINLYNYGFDYPNFYGIMQSEFRKSAMFRFDWFIKSRTQYELERRMGTLLSAIEKEYLENHKDEISFANLPSTKGPTPQQSSKSENNDEILQPKQIKVGE